MNLDKYNNLFENFLSPENRLAYKLTTRKEATPGSEVISEHEDMIKGIDRNISLYPTRYKTFEKSSKSRALLLAILKRRQKKNPKNNGGFTENNPNLNLIALGNTKDKDILTQSTSAKQKIRKERGKYAKRANDIQKKDLANFPANFFQTPREQWHNVSAQRWLTHINTHLGTNALQTHAFRDRLRNNTPHAGMITFFENLQTETTLSSTHLNGFDRQKRRYPRNLHPPCWRHL